MQRRHLLALLGAAGTAGCTALAPSADHPADASPTDTLTPAPATPGTGSGTSPDDAPIAAAPGDCPSFDDDVRRIVCTDAAPADAPMVLEPSTTDRELPGTITFALTNGTDVRYDTNFYSWRVAKRVDGRWYHVAPTSWNQPLMSMAPGDSHAWHVSMDGEDYDGEVVPPSGGTSDVSVAALGGGEYAFGIDGWFAGEDHEHQTAFGARFTLRGDPLALTTTGHLANVRVDGDEVRARWTYHAGDGDAREAVYRLDRTEDAAGGRSLLTEQVVRFGRPGEPLRDALALATTHGAASVRLRGPTTTSPPFGVHGRTIEYGGAGYRITAGTIETAA